MLLTNGGKCLNAWLAFAFLVTCISSGGGGASVCSESSSFIGGGTARGEGGSVMKQISMMRAKPASISEYPNIECT
jgi:hypothetical protein